MHSVCGIVSKRIKSRLDPFISVLSYFISKQVRIFHGKKLSDKKIYYYIPLNDRTLELTVFLPSDTESLINELRFSESISLSFKTRLMSVTCICSNVT